MADGEVDPLSPEHVVNLVRFLASPAADGVNGQVFIVYGPTVTLVAAPAAEHRTSPPTATPGTRQTSATTLAEYFADRDPEPDFSATGLLDVARLTVLLWQVSSDEIRTRSRMICVTPVS